MEEIFDYLDGVHFCSITEIAMAVMDYWDESVDDFTPSLDDLIKAQVIAVDYVKVRGFTELLEKENDDGDN